MRIPKFLLRKPCCALCLLALALLGCNRPANQDRTLGTLEGSVFVVTEGRENIKMGLVKVRVFHETNVLGVVQARKPMVESALAELRSRKAQATEDSAQSRKLLADADAKDAEAKKLRKEGDEVLEYVESKIKRDAESRRETGLTLPPELLAKQRSLLEALIGDAKEKFADSAALTNSAAALRADGLRLAVQAKSVSDEAARWPATSAAMYFTGLASPGYEAKTDADGRFTLQLPANTRFAVVAQAERATPAGREEYHWLFWVSLNGAKSKSIMLSNDNLMRANDPDSVVKLESP